ncbi:RNA-binding protein [Schizosaccharomyces japonicus yFS275]|uniref:RNA-binding protein n=1 Tax=Schizosaccharomyces japonicus (strain yFS275 / FY16936) TaxID=402676 RepID=B6K6R7_SCHJY|nr:RNA-binding protein [Schizosaccharomyces japonicus yFS275]EEB09221.1 RNA-binding protein [Schizosaccharomyces japonicus yFS275]
MSSSSSSKAVKTTVVRKAGGQVWEDPTLLEWDPNHFRLFCGDLGNDVTDETLYRAFTPYPTLVKAKVVRDHTGKSKGYGFVSFRDPEQFLRAWREMNGKYIGNRICKLSRAKTEVGPSQVTEKSLTSKIRNSKYSRIRNHGNRVQKKNHQKQSASSLASSTARVLGDNKRSSTDSSASWQPRNTQTQRGRR